MQFLKMLSILALVVVFMPVGMQAQNITPVRAKLRANKGALVVDVRERDEVATVAYDVKNVVNIPLSELKSRMTEIPKDQPVILACKTGDRSGQAMGILKANGYTQVSNIEGGILAWEAKDLAVVKGGAPAKACCSGSAAKSCGSAGTSAATTGEAAPAKACGSGSTTGAAAKNCGSSSSSASTTDAAAPAKACCAGGAKAEAAKSCGAGGTSADAAGGAAPAKACCAGGAKAGHGGR